MKNYIFSFLVLSLSVTTTFAQDNVGIGTLTPNAKAILDLTSADKGLLAPRLSTAQRLAISPTTSEEALLVFDTDLKFYFYWDGTQWVQFPGNDADSDPANELITNVVFNSNGNILTIDEGGNTWSTIIGIDINDADADPTNEIQNLSLNGNTLSISLGNSVDLTGFTNTDEQTLSLNGNILSISNGNSVTLPADNDADPTNELNTSFSFDSISNILSVTDAGGALNTSLLPIVNGYNTAINNAVTNLTNLINNIASQSGNDWKLTGNAGTTPATNYIGTSDNAGLSIRTVSTERIRITNTGLVGIGQVPSYPLDVLNQTRLTRANGSLGVPNESQLELFNGGAGDVFISFHKAGVWGAHFGLDATNWFSTQGWSAGTGFTNLRTGSLQVNGAIQITGGGPQSGFILQSNDAAGNASWVSPSTIVNNVNNNNNYNILPTGSHVGLCVRNTSDGCCNCNARVMAPITGWGSGCPPGYSFEQIAARWNGLNERWVYACIRN